MKNKEVKIFPILAVFLGAYGLFVSNHSFEVKLYAIIGIILIIGAVLTFINTNSTYASIQSTIGVLACLGFVIIIESLFVPNVIMESMQFWCYVLLTAAIFLINYFAINDYHKTRISPFKERERAKFRELENKLSDFNSLMSGFKKAEWQILNRIENLKKFQKTSLDLNILNGSFSGLNVISRFYGNRHLKSYDELKNVNSVQNYKFVTEYYADKLVNNDKSAAWFVCLVNPKIWFINPDWNDSYVIPMLRTSATLHSSTDIRRQYIFKEEDYMSDTNNYSKKINSILLLELLVGVNSRIMLLDSDITGQESSYEIAGLSPIDFALFYSHSKKRNYFNRKNKVVACSEIIPYFSKELPTRNIDYSDLDQVNIFPLYNYDSFNKFKEQFLNFWHIEEYSQSVGEPVQGVKSFSLFSLIEKTVINSDSFDWSFISSVLVTKIGAKNKNKLENEVQSELKKNFEKLCISSTKNLKTFNEIFEEYILNEVNDTMDFM